MKKLLKALIVMLSLVLVAGCSTPAATPDPTASADPTATNGGTKEYTIAYSVQTLANPYFVTVSEGLKSMDKKLVLKLL